MAILDIPVWPFEPNWTSNVTEVLEWLTDVMTSPTGSEQRRSLRQFPRRTFEFTAATIGDERTLLDNLLVSYGAQRWYLPLWHDVSFVESAVLAGAVALPCSDAEDSRLRADSVAYIVNDSVYEHELVEIESVTSSAIILKSATARSWPAGSRVYPVSVAKFTDQPVATKRSDSLVTVDVRFASLDDAASISVPDTEHGMTEIYRDFPVINGEPDDARRLQAGHDRMLLELDNKFSIPRWVDTAGRTFTHQQHAWVLAGRTEHIRFEGLTQHLRGRANPIWVPTFMDDMHLALAIAEDATTMTVERCGFTLSGGPRPDRQDIVIELDGTRIFRRITASALDAQGREVLALDAPIAQEVRLVDPIRISFMTLMRLNHDTVQIEHMTDNTGVSTALTTFRSAPDTRVPEPAF